MLLLLLLHAAALIVPYDDNTLATNLVTIMQVEAAKKTAAKAGQSKKK
jgi:hypothetical protein